MSTPPRTRRSPAHPLAGMNTSKRRRPDSSSEEEPEDQLPSSSGLPPSSPPPSMRSDDENIMSDGVRTEDDGGVSEGSEPEGEDLFGEDMMEDYVTNRRLDAYEKVDIDDASDVEELRPEMRTLADLKMDRRDLREGRYTREGSRAGRRRRDRAPAFLMSDHDEEDVEDEELFTRRRRRRGYDERPGSGSEMGGEDELPVEQLADIKANSLREWVETPVVSRTIQKEFKNFLQTYVDEAGKSVYGQRILTLGEANSESLEVSFVHLMDTKPILSYFLSNAPSSILSLFDEVALDAVLLYYPSYERIHSEVHVRITELPTSYTLRDLRQVHLDALVRVAGVVTRRTGVFPQLKYVKFDCGKCGEVLGPFYQDGVEEVKIKFCQACGAKGPFTINSEQTVYRNFQKMTLQESPGTVPPGRLPRHREVFLLWDLIDSAKPGEEVEITGIYRNLFDASLNIRNGFPVFSTILEANHINKKTDLFASFRLTEEDEREIRQLAKDERIQKRIIKSIAPSIYGHEDIKTAIALSLFGGNPKDINRKHRIRGDINVLLLGDPGTAKSQFLKFTEKTAMRAVFATGQGASAVGLTASVRKDPVTREWTLEGGALVLADRGVCLIDEFDKMNDADRTSIHEAMEQQSISISKAGIVTSLQARCAIIAAANPIRGRYNPTLPFSQNVELTEPILSRFDILCVVRDLVDPAADERLAQFVVGSHTRSHPDFEEEDEAGVATMEDAEIIPHELLKKYIQYARERVRPKLGQIDQEKLSKLYGELRRESLQTGSYPITVRHLESTIRLAEASAKMALREYVRSDDVNLAIRVEVNSFVNAQKTSIRKTLERGFRKYIQRTEDQDELLAFILGQLVKEKYRYSQIKNRQDPSSVIVKISELEDRVKDIEIFNIRPFLNSKIFKNNGYKKVNETIVKEFKVDDQMEEDD